MAFPIFLAFDLVFRTQGPADRKKPFKTNSVMLNILFTLVMAGMIAGLIQYFVDFKKLQIQTDETSGGAGRANAFLQFFSDRWEFFAYILIGIAGALLVPLIHTWITLKGLDEVAGYVTCVSSGQQSCRLDSWTTLVVLGYGIVFGYSTVRLLRSVLSIVLSKLPGATGGGSMQTRINDLERALQALVHQQAQAQQVQPDDKEAQAELQTLGGAPSCSQNPRPWDGKPWRVAESLLKMRQQVNALAPNRRTTSDGSIGDLSHQQTDSDHNPWILDGAKGIVSAIDITHDPDRGCDCQALASSLQRAKDGRIKYVIWNRQIMSSYAINGTAAWVWRSYSGTNPHVKHIHISVNCDKATYDDVNSWSIQVS